MKIFLSYIILFFSFSLMAQKEIKITASSVYFDHLGNIYSLNKETLNKQNTQAKDLQYQNSFLGNISLIDVSDPLRILLFYKDANQILFLNNELSPINEPINLDELSLFDVDKVCNASINGFWVFNKIEKRLIFFDKQLKKKYQSMDLSSFVNNDQAIVEMKMFGDKIYLNIPDRGLVIFDMFASYIKTIPLKKVSDFQVFSQAILYATDSSVYLFDKQKLETKKIIATQSPIKKIYYTNSVLFYFSDNRIFQQKIQL